MSTDIIASLTFPDGAQDHGWTSPFLKEKERGEVAATALLLNHRWHLLGEGGHASR